MSSSVSQGRGRFKRFWTTDEDKALVVALHELSVDPHWKCENGFRNGYLHQLETKLEKAIPGSGLKEKPHIDSRLKTLVSKFRAILQMLGTSGFRWDDERHMISVERSVYDEYCKVHPACRNLYGVSFPHLNVMMKIYGKDYATGKSAEGFEDAVRNMEKEKEVEPHINLGDDDDDDGSHSIYYAPPSKKSKRDKTSKAKTNIGSSSSDFKCLQHFMKDMNDHLASMASVWIKADNREQDTEDKTDKVLGELLQVDGLSRAEVVAASRALIARPLDLKLFFSYPLEMKADFVKDLLRDCASSYYLLF